MCVNKVIVEADETLLSRRGKIPKTKTMEDNAQNKL